MSRQCTTTPLLGVLIGLCACRYEHIARDSARESADTAPDPVDLDGDGFAGADDCDDTNSQVNPARMERCNGLDDDCDGDLDESAAVDAPTWYTDADGDGYGDPDSAAPACEAPAGHIADDNDCDAADPTTFPAAEEICDDYIVNDCDGTFASAMEGCRLTGTLTLPDGGLAVSGLSSGDAAGTSVGSGDLNGDGYDDLLIGAHQREVATAFSDGAVYLVPGPLSRSGVALDAGDVIQLSGPTAGSWFGTSLASGDVDGDGYYDLLVGAPGWPDTASESGTAFTGVAYFKLGPVTASGVFSGTAEFAVVGAAAGVNLAHAVAMAQADASDEPGLLLLGGHGASSYGTSTGAAYVFEWPPSSDIVDTSAAVLVITGVNALDEAGFDLSGAGDVDGDGVDDVIVGAAQVYDSGATGVAYLVSGTVRGSLVGTDADHILVGENPEDAAGRAVAAAGDVDGDGADDVIVGATGFDGGDVSLGAAYVVTEFTSESMSLGAATARLVGESSYDHAGHTVSGAGDVDLDGFADLLIGASGVDSATYADRGAVYLVYGGDHLASMSLGSADLKIIGPDDSTMQQLGIALTPAADLDSDDYLDLILGSGCVWNGTGDCPVNGTTYVMWGTGP